MRSAPLDITIAGAGIGGLTTALALARNGITSKIFEQRSDAIEAGAGIQLGPNATGVLSRLGLLDDVLAVSAEPDALSIHDGISGRVLARFPLGRWMRDRYGAPYLTLHRQDLHRALLSAAVRDARIEIASGRTVASFQDGAAHVDARMADGQLVSASALIAADGLWSQLRACVAKGAFPQPTEKCAYRAVVAATSLPSQLAANDVHIWLAPGAHVVHYPVRRGTETAIVVVIDDNAQSDAWDCVANVDRLAKSAVARLAPQLSELILSHDDWRMWRLQTLVPLRQWVRGRAALLGDAAHPVLPFFAQGGGLAIEDAEVLGHCLAGSGTVEARLRFYEISRRRRAQRVAAASVSNGRVYHMAGAGAMARNAVLATVPGTWLMRRYDWLYGWTPDQAFSSTIASV